MIVTSLVSEYTGAIAVSYVAKAFGIKRGTTVRDARSLCPGITVLPARHDRYVDIHKSPTWDRGHELAAHRKFTVATNIDVYFCDPQNPWQRGSNENTNRLLRQYFPKGTDIAIHSQAKLNQVARQMNERP